MNEHQRWARKMTAKSMPLTTELEQQGADRERRRIRRMLAPVLIGLCKDGRYDVVERIDAATRAPRRRK